MMMVIAVIMTVLNLTVTLVRKTMMILTLILRFRTMQVLILNDRGGNDYDGVCNKRLWWWWWCG